MAQESGNPTGRPNSDVERPINNGSDITRRLAGHWLWTSPPWIWPRPLITLPPCHVETHVQPNPYQQQSRGPGRKVVAARREAPALRTPRRISPTISPHRRLQAPFLREIPIAVAPEHSLIVIPRKDDTTW
jgi:hypothetical protein